MVDSGRQEARTRARTWSARVAVAILIAWSLIGCDGTTTVAPTGSPTSGAHVGTFPGGVFAKERDEPGLGLVRFVWNFADDGRWAEIPFALEGQAAPLTPVRGSWSVDGDTVTIATDWPPGWGTSVHRWRLEGGLLWTTFVSSDVPEDQDWFAGWDAIPWVPSS